MQSLVAAGYVLYSASTELVLTFGHGVVGFTLDTSCSASSSLKRLWCVEMGRGRNLEPSEPKGKSALQVM